MYRGIVSWHSLPPAQDPNADQSRRLGGDGGSGESVLPIIIGVTWAFETGKHRHGVLRSEHNQCAPREPDWPLDTGFTHSNGNLTFHIEGPAMPPLIGSRPMTTAEKQKRYRTLQYLRGLRAREEPRWRPGASSP